MKKLLWISLVAILFSVHTALSQDYDFAIGGRGGITASGVTLKYNFDPANSVEALIDFVKGVNFYALYERNMPVITSGFNFYYGGGINLGGWKKHGENKFTTGINGVIGLEYKLLSAPVAFSIDYKPNLNVTGRTGFHAADFGLGIKLAF